MNDSRCARWWMAAALLLGLGGLLTASAQQPAADKDKSPVAPGTEIPGKGKGLPPGEGLHMPKQTSERTFEVPPDPPSILTGEIKLLDLISALRLAGVENPEILLAQQQVVEARALRFLTLAKALLPNINVGLNLDAHVGNLQQSNGNILSLNRDALYLGLGANAVAAGSVNIPGVVYNMNVGSAIFSTLVARQVVNQRAADSVAVRNQIFLQVAAGYVELLRSEGQRAIALKNRDDARTIAELTASYANTGQGRPADADRARTELMHRNDLLLEAEGRVLTASANLARLLNLDPSIQLHAIDGWVVPAPIVPDAAPLPDLIFTALNNRPELAARRAAIRAATLELASAKYQIFSPNLLVGLSAGTFGGGSNLVAQPGGFLGFHEGRFDSFAPRDDIDGILYWTAQNMGVGNLAQIRLQRANLRIRDLELVRTLNVVRNQVATSYARAHARFGQIGITQQAVESSQKGYEEDLIRTRGFQALPIELINSFDLLSRARVEYLDAISDYNRAEFELFVALGQPPKPFLTQPIPSSLVPAPAVPPLGAPGAGPCPPGMLPPGVVASQPVRDGSRWGAAQLPTDEPAARQGQTR